MVWGLIARAWWDRFWGRLKPRPYPFVEATLLDSPLRTLLFGPRCILAALDLKPGQRVLDVGSGTGYYSLETARRIGDGGRLTCLDIQGEMLVRTRRRLCAAGFESAEFVRASAEHLPFLSGSFDHVLLVTVLGEIPDRSQALREIRRALRPGGRLSVSEQLPDPDFVTPSTLRRQLHASGFVEEVTRRHFLLAYTSVWRADKSEQSGTGPASSDHPSGRDANLAAGRQASIPSTRSFTRLR